jgi:hypothetical protein
LAKKYKIYKSRSTTSQQAAENERSSRLRGIQNTDAEEQRHRLCGNRWNMTREPGEGSNCYREQGGYHLRISAGNPVSWRRQTDHISSPGMFCTPFMP